MAGHAEAYTSSCAQRAWAPPPAEIADIFRCLERGRAQPLPHGMVRGPASGGRRDRHAPVNRRRPQKGTGRWTVQTARPGHPRHRDRRGDLARRVLRARPARGRTGRRWQRHRPRHRASDEHREAASLSKTFARCFRLKIVAIAGLRRDRGRREGNTSGVMTRAPWLASGARVIIRAASRRHTHHARLRRGG